MAICVYEVVINRALIFFVLDRYRPSLNYLQRNCSTRQVGPNNSVNGAASTVVPGTRHIQTIYIYFPYTARKSEAEFPNSSCGLAPVSPAHMTAPCTCGL